MYIHITGDKFSDYIFKEIALITDHSVVDINDVRYHANEKKISFIFKRFDLLKIKRNILFEYTKYDDKEIKSKCIINNVLNYEINSQANVQQVKTFTLHGGVIINNNNIYFCSTEENQGKIIYSVCIVVNYFDIYLSDN